MYLYRIKCDHKRREEMVFESTLLKAINTGLSELTDFLMFGCGVILYEILWKYWGYFFWGFKIVLDLDFWKEMTLKRRNTIIGEVKYLI